MKKLCLILYLACSIFTFQASAEDAAQTAKPAKETKKFVYDKKICDTAAANIGDSLKEHTSCWKDEDCKMYDFGYPWQTNECIKTIISIDQKEKIVNTLARIETYKQACIATDKEEQKKYDQLQKKLKKANCAPVPLLCLRGVCRTSTYAIIDSNDSNKLKIDDANKPKTNNTMFDDATIGKYNENK